MAEPYIQGASKYKIKVGVIFNIDFSMIWSRYELNLPKQWKMKNDVKKIFLSIAFYKDKNSKLGSIIESVFIAWARNGHVLVTVLIFGLLTY